MNKSRKEGLRHGVLKFSRFLLSTYFTQGHRLQIGIKLPMRYLTEKQVPLVPVVTVVS